MKKLISAISLMFVVAILAVAQVSQTVESQEVAGKVFELRTYKSTPGNLNKLLTRFRDHTMRIFEKHGMTNIGYWIPTDETESADTLVYLLSHDSQEAAMNSWRAFSQDPEWQKVNTDSNANGPILDSVQRKFMTAADFSQMK
ncbi:MAG: NIPSNAP family protein [Gammaproteobacteria bacterium]|nr:NIPSNAP family protein [Gammaproteobacteria bacterium]MDP2142227.1 NIPSNAP family protein [Gammaproteobacteria bacterium]MDP2347876.1 NIPSNAP family protein [Gammaproteobacteria bacterium]